MAFIPASAVARASIEGIQDNQQIINTLYFLKLSPPINIFAIADLAIALDLWFSGAILPTLSESYFYSQVICRDLTSEFAVTGSSNVNQGTGGNPSEPAPNNVAGCISFRTGFVGRSFRGRNYVPGIPNDMLNKNTLDSDFTDAIVSGYTDLITAANAAGWVWVVCSFQANGAPRAAGLPTAVSSAMFVDQTVDSQRRRLPGRGA